MDLEEGILKNFIQHRSGDGISYTIKRYRPRMEGLFARIEKWMNDNSGEVHWRMAKCSLMGATLSLKYISSLMVSIEYSGFHKLKLPIR